MVDKAQQTQDTQNPEGQTQNPEVKPGSPEYEQQMRDKFRGQQQRVDDQENQDKPQAPEMPEGGQDKFYNKETGAYNWEAHAKELMYRQQQQAQKGDQQQQQEGDQQQQEDEDQQVQNIIERAGLNPQELAQQIATNGKLDDNARNSLIQQGIPGEMVDSYVSALSYQASAERQEALNYVGGEESWNQMKSWAQNNLNEQEIEQIDQLLSGPNWKTAVNDLKTRMKQASPTGREGHLQHGQGGGGPTGYTSKDEMKRDMGSERYQKDASFRAEVAQRIRNASWKYDQ